MKLKEKLAQEYTEGPTCELMDTYQVHEESYLAGFEKAREMAVFIANGIHTETSWKVGHDIQNMGEEEV